MKRIVFLLTMSLPVLMATAQKVEDVKNLVTLNQYKQAKTEVDKGMSNPKFTAKPEAYILKATTYAALSLDEGTKNTPAGDQMTNDADGAFKKYKELDPAMPLVEDLIYQNGVLNIYYSYYGSGYNEYLELTKAKEKTPAKWDPAATKLKKAVEYSDLLISKQILKISVDTNILILAGIASENSSNKEDAVKYYSRLADHKIVSDGFESVYRYLVTYYFGKKDMPAFEKYKAFGKELYPKSDFFGFDKVDFAVGLEETLDGKIKAVEDVLATDPNNFKANEVMGEVIFDALNPKEETQQIPANADELEKKMVIAFNKAASLKANYENPYLYLGDHFINKAVVVDKDREKHAADMKARTKPGTMASKEDVAKRDALDKKYGETLEQAREPYEKAAGIYGARPTLDLKEKQQYKKAASYLADIFAFKKIQSKAKPADAAKYAAEEKKWNDLWETIK